MATDEEQGDRAMRLRTRLSATMLALALVPLVVVTLAVALPSAERLRLAAQRYQLATASAVEADVTRALSLARSELGGIGALLGDASLAAADRTRLARAALLRSAEVDRFTLYRADGMSVLSLASDGAVAARAPAKLDAVTMRAAQRKLGFALGAPQVVGTGAKRTVSMTLVLPLWRRGAAKGKRALHGFVAAPISLRPLSQLVAAVSQERFGRRSDRVLIFDASLRVIAAHDPARLGKSLARDPALADFRTADGKLAARSLGYVAAYQRGGEALLGTVTAVAGMGWHVLVEQGRARAYAALSSLWRIAGLVGAGALLVALVLGLVLAGRLARPVVAVADGARRVASGDFEARIPEPRRLGEVSEMAHAFNVMAADLRSYSAEIVEQTRIRGDLSRYLSADLVERVVNKQAELRLGGERKRVTVLFADVVAFTPLAEKNDPESVVAILNELFTFLTEIVFKHGGVVDKFVGDCIMAVFGIPDPSDDDAESAVSAALEMIDWLEVGNAKWRKELGRELSLGIGINTGEVVAGNLGSEKRMEYTVIGDTVNIAARLETLAQPGQVLLAEATRDAIDEDTFELEDLGEHKVAGRAEAIHVYEAHE